MWKKPISISILLILVLAILLRLWGIDAIPLWHDEAFSALLVSDYDFLEMMHRIGLDVHPPFYYIVLRAWVAITGDSLLALRAFSAFFGVLTVLAAYYFVKLAFAREKLALIAALLVAVNPFQIQYATEARMYTLGTFLMVLAAIFMVNAFRAEGRGKYCWWLLTGFSIAALAHTHYYALFSIAALVLFALYLYFREYKLNIKGWFKDTDTIPIILAIVIIVASYLPWLPVFASQVSQVQENYWIPAPDSWSVPHTFWALLVAGTYNSSEVWYRLVMVVLLVASLAIAAYVIRKYRSNPFNWLAIFGFFVPLLLAIALSFQTAIYLDRYFVFAGVFYLIIIAIFLGSIPSKLWRTLLVSAAVLASVYAVWFNWGDYNPKENRGIEGVVTVLDEHWQPEDKIYFASSFIFFNFRYYNPTTITPKLYAPGDVPHFSGSALLEEDKSDQISSWNQETESDDMVWLFWTTGFGGTDPKIPKNWTKINEWRHKDPLAFRGEDILVQYRVD